MRYLIGLFLLGMAGCCTAPSKYPRVPYWIDGIANVTSRMLEKNTHWQDLIDKQVTSRAQERDLIKSNTRFFRLLLEYIKIQKENEINNELESAQEGEDNYGARTDQD